MSDCEHPKASVYKDDFLGDWHCDSCRANLGKEPWNPNKILCPVTKGKMRENWEVEHGR